MPVAATDEDAVDEGGSSFRKGAGSGIIIIIVGIPQALKFGMGEYVFEYVVSGENAAAQDVAFQVVPNACVVIDVVIFVPVVFIGESQSGFEFLGHPVSCYRGNIYQGNGSELQSQASAEEKFIGKPAFFCLPVFLAGDHRWEKKEDQQG